MVVQTMVGGGANLLHTPTKTTLTLRKSMTCYSFGLLLSRFSIVMAFAACSFLASTTFA